MSPTRSSPPSDYPEGHDDILFKTNCPKCQADWPEARAFAVYADGHGHCHKCGHHTPPGSAELDGGGELEVANGRTHGRSRQVVGMGNGGRHIAMSSDLLTPSGQEAFQDLQKRRLKATTLSRYGYFLAPFGKQRVTAQVSPYFDQGGHLVAQKLRLPDKEFVTLGDAKLVNHQLFGQQLFGEKNDLRVVVTEGELDAMSVAQATGFKFPAVSISGGAKSAKKCIQANYRWLDRFKEIVLWFDDDEEGRAATEECAKLFSYGKVKVAKVHGSKDASDVLQANRPGDIELAIFSATTWSPVGIVNAADTEDDVVFKEVPSWHYPFDGLQDKTKGARRGEIAFWVAGSGIGKTTILFKLYHHFLFGDGHTETPAKIGWLGFEGVRRDVVLGFLSVDQNRRLHLDPLPEAKMREAHRKVFGSRRVELFDQESASWEFEAVLGYIRYMARALECNIIMIDPLSYLIAMMNERDERVAIDKATASLSQLAKELGVHIDINHHLTRPKDGKSHEEGGQVSLAQLRGSNALGQFTSQAVGFERNQQAENEEQKTLTRVRIIKNRFVGWDGVCSYLQYDSETGQTYEIPFDQGRALWGDEEGGGGKQGSPFTDDQDF